MSSGFVDVDENETLYEGVRHKKMTGKTTLASASMTFQSSTGETIVLEWRAVAKHMVSPVKSGKHLLKLIFMDGRDAVKFEFTDRASLENARKDISRLLKAFRSTTPEITLSGKKRGHAAMIKASNNNNNSFEDLDPTALAVARSAVLAAHAKLRQQHQYLVEESQTVTEDDFWKTHEDLLAEEYARMAGLTKAGSSSILQSHVPASGRVTLGVEEMRQIFILYPAVHKAYEEKVPLELSDEQFWRKYLESEYFHRDRGRRGTAARNHAGGAESAEKVPKGKTTGLTVEEQDARAAAVGADDLFSRYEQKLQEAKVDEGNESTKRRRWGTRLGVGQFDLAKTLETERGNLLAGPRDNHPANQADDGKGARVVEKYNRHWAMVLHPDEAVAGADLLAIAHKSAAEAADNEDATPGGGVNEEMLRLVEFASANPEEVDHANGQGLESADYEPLTLENIEVYHSAQPSSAPKESAEALAQKHTIFAQAMVQKTKEILDKVIKQQATGVLPETCFPPTDFGRKMLAALTQKMEKDARTEAESVEMVSKLPPDFKENLQTHFRRSSELLRHFFALRRLEEKQGGSATTQKLTRVVSAMQQLYREMEQARNHLPQSQHVEDMRNMYLPIMYQLDLAFKKYNAGSGGGGGGFVDVEN